MNNLEQSDTTLANIPLGPLVSVILPCYNVDAYLERCMASISCQNYLNYEIILVNDGSTDRTALLCDGFSDRLPDRVNVIHQENRGVSRARNAGLDIAVGEYILFVDPDDYLEPEFFSKVVTVAENSKSDVVIFGFNILTQLENGTIEESYDLPKPVHAPLNDAQSILAQVLPRFIGISLSDVYLWKTTGRLAPNKEFASVWRFLYRREIIERNGVRFEPEIRLGEDTIFNSSYLSCCSSYQSLPERLYNYTVKQGGAMMANLNDGKKLVGNKLGLLNARIRLRDSILVRTGVDIESLYQGSTVFSVLELAAKLAVKDGDSFDSKYRRLMEYGGHPQVCVAIAVMKAKMVPLKLGLPLRLLQLGGVRLLFAVVFCLNRLGFPIRL